MTRRYEVRDVVEPIDVQAPAEREGDFSDRRDDEAREEHSAVAKIHAPEQVEQDGPDGGADRELAEEVGVDVGCKADDERRRDENIVRRTQAVHRRRAS